MTITLVFPADSKTGYINDPKKAVLKVVELSGVPFTLHDLRRTFATIAEGLDLPAYALKRLLNHKMNNDVTAGYIMRDVERLRKPMQRIAAFLIEHMASGILHSANFNDDISVFSQEGIVGIAD